MRSKNALKNIITSLLLQAVTIIYGFLIPKIIITNFGSNTNGLISSITQFLAYITLLESGFGPVVKSVLYKPIANKDYHSISSILRTSEHFFRSIAVIFLIYIAALCFVYPMFVNGAFGWVFTASLIVIIGISTFFEYFFGMAYRLFLQAKQKTYVISVIQIFTYILSAIIVVILVKVGANIHIVKLVSGVIFVIRPLLQNLYVKKKYNIDIKDGDKHYPLKEKWDGLAQHVASVIHNSTDVTVLTIMSSLAEVSVYSVYCLVTNGIKKIMLSFANGIDAAFGDMLAKGEKSKLKKAFNIYEVLFNIVTTIVLTCTIVLITPLITLYTSGADDANYVRPLFGALIVISEYICIIRHPYLAVTHAAGHFKETRKGAWVECVSNIVISVILVGKLGIVGVAIGTIFAMTIRTIEFVYHANKYILERPVWESAKKILLVVVETISIILISQLLPLRENNSYFDLILNSMEVFSLACIITLGFNFVFFRKELLESRKLLKHFPLKHKRHNSIDNSDKM